MAKADAAIRRRSEKAVRALTRLARVRAAFIFGSQVSGNTTPWSDIDIAAFVEGVEAWDIRRRARAMVLVREAAGADIEMHLLPASAFPAPPAGSFAAYVLRHGISLDIGEPPSARSSKPEAGSADGR